MSDYTKNTDYASKDALISGDPAKLIKGTELGKEFDDIATAIATKYDAGDAASFSTVTVTSGQIVFPATQNASSNANTLDDYEEGTWTPVVVGGSTAGIGTYVYQIGTYTKIGRVVTYTCSLSWTAHSGSGILRITGLPFTSTSSGAVYHVSSALADSLTFSGQLVGTVGGSSSTLSLSSFVSGSNATSVVLDVSANLYLSGSYEV